MSVLNSAQTCLLPYKGAVTVRGSANRHVARWATAPEPFIYTIKQIKSQYIHRFNGLYMLEADDESLPLLPVREGLAC